ncbi:MAG TPA: ABC transporter permease [Candidatus Angelobacter sp.]
MKRTIAEILRAHIDTLWQDVAWSLRTLRRSAGFTLTVVIVAALGIGGNTAAFTLLDYVLLRPLPFSHPENLVMVYQTQSMTGGGRVPVSPANFRDWQTMNKSFESLGGYTPRVLNLSGQGEPQQLSAVAVTSELFHVLRVQPAMGRGFNADDEREGAPGAAVLGIDLASALYGNAADALGRTIRLDNQPFTITGIMPAGFAFPTRDAQLWIPLQFSADMFTDPDNRANLSVTAIGRLQPGISNNQANMDLGRIAAQLQQAFPKENKGIGAGAVKLQDVISPKAKMLVIAVFGAASCVMLIACTNLASLLFARFSVRRREVAIRMAIGAGRPRLLRQLFTENFVLALLGGVLGLVLADFMMPTLVRLVPEALPVSGVPVVDLRVFFFAALLTIATCIAFGAVPALRASRQLDAAALRVKSALGGRSDRLRTALVLAEIVCTVTLLVSAGLLLRALWRVQKMDPGFHADNVLTLRTRLSMPKYSEQQRRTQLFSNILSKTRSLPGVESAAYTSFIPMVFGGGIFPVTTLETRASGETAVQSSIRYVTPDFFTTLGIPIVQGRGINDHDTSTAPFVAVVSESLARNLWPGQNPLDHPVNVTFHDRKVIGVVRDIAVRGLEQASEPQIYLSSQQVADGELPFFVPKDLVVRVTHNPDAIVPAIRRIIHEADPELPVSNVQMVKDIVYSQTASRRAQLRVLGAFGVVAFLLAAIGIYGLLSFAVSVRTPEVGLRLALGAKPGKILNMFLRKGMVLSCAGVAIALPLSYFAARGMSALLFGVQPGDPLVYVAAALLAVGLALGGSFIPALRAARVNPAITVRAE